MKGRGWVGLLHPLVAAQNFEFVLPPIVSSAMLITTCQIQDFEHCAEQFPTLCFKLLLTRPLKA